MLTGAFVIAALLLQSQVAVPNRSLDRPPTLIQSAVRLAIAVPPELVGSQQRQSRRAGVIAGAMLGAGAMAAWCGYICAEAPNQSAAVLQAAATGAIIGALIGYAVQ